MQTKRLVGWSIGGALVAAWMAAATPSDPQVPERSVTPGPAVRAALAAPEFATEAERLRTFMSAPPAPHRPARNPFTFGGREAPVMSLPDESASAAAAMPEVSAVSPPAVDLIGIATKRAPDGTPVYTAIVSVEGRMQFLAVGDGVLPGTVVADIDGATVTLDDGTGTRRLRLP
ncbi:MAG TPA: hypothetical protein DCP38_09025 [Acidobacteria bacterium]|jgi:hypothetical protein|nr:hypothetical protein [Acidobacteriota bacterium]HAK55608.1 hypothetical protein [Acidobacteriota bacterium]|tara:strand:- start:4915 stop:5436 length:522 start_codon:yes stop_codon:yes gene_type:complete